MWSVVEQVLIRINHLLSIAGESRPSDLIFVLAGRQSRKQYALELFQKGMAPRLLLSVARFDVRKLAALALPACVDLLPRAKSLPPEQRYFFLSFTADTWETENIRKGRWGTLSEIEALAAWLKQHTDVSSVQIVSSGFHLRRVRLCCEALLPEAITKYYVAVPNDPDPAKLTRDRMLQVYLASEVLKLLMYWPVLRLRVRG